MIEQTFKLVPFPAPEIPPISITGKLSLENDVLTLHYVLAGDMKHILLPPVSMNPSRKDGLWRETCFEFFLAVKDEPAYWEFNMSSSGDWNVYCMDAYRQIGFREETAFSRFPFSFEKETHSCSLDVSVNLAPLIESRREIQIAITTVIQTKSGETHWALTHPAAYADFHLRESFILELAEQTRLSPQSARDG